MDRVEYLLPYSYSTLDTIHYSECFRCILLSPPKLNVGILKFIIVSGFIATFGAGQDESPDAEYL